MESDRLASSDNVTGREGGWFASSVGVPTLWVFAALVPAFAVWLASTSVFATLLAMWVTVLAVLGGRAVITGTGLLQQSWRGMFGLTVWLGAAIYEARGWPADDVLLSVEPLTWGLLAFAAEAIFAPRRPAEH